MQAPYKGGLGGSTREEGRSEQTKKHKDIGRKEDVIPITEKSVGGAFGKWDTGEKPASRARHCKVESMTRRCRMQLAKKMIEKGQGVRATVRKKLDGIGAGIKAEGADYALGKRERRGGDTAESVSCALNGGEKQTELRVVTNGRDTRGS